MNDRNGYELLSSWCAWQRAGGTPSTTIKLRRHYLSRLAEDLGDLADVDAVRLAEWLGARDWSPIVPGKPTRRRCPKFAQRLKNRHHARMAELTPVADAISTRLASSSLTQQTAANELGMSRVALNSRLNGHTRWRADELPAVADLLGVTVADLYASEVPA